MTYRLTRKTSTPYVAFDQEGTVLSRHRAEREAVEACLNAGGGRYTIHDEVEVVVPDAPAPEPEPEPEPVPEPEPEPEPGGYADGCTETGLFVQEGSVSLTGGTAGLPMRDGHIYGVDFRGEVRVKAGTYKFRQCRFRGNGYFGIRSLGGQVTDIRQCTFDGSGDSIKQACIAYFEDILVTDVVARMSGDFIKLGRRTVLDGFDVQSLATPDKHADCLQWDDGASGVLIARNGRDIGTSPTGDLGNSFVQSKGGTCQVTLDNVTSQRANYIVNVQGAGSSIRVRGGRFAPTLDGSLDGFRARTAWRAQDGASLDVGPDVQVVDAL